MRPLSDNVPCVDVQDEMAYSQGGEFVPHHGPVTVMFRLVAFDTSPSQESGPAAGSLPVTPLHTPFTQSPATSPNMKVSSSADSIAYPPNMPGMHAPGVYYTAAMGAHPQFYHPAAAPVGVPAMHEEVHFMKQRALSAEIHQSPHFHYQPPPHRLSFNATGPMPHDKEGLPFVSAEMLMSAMPERYDD
jgi:hypothetical protein